MTKFSFSFFLFIRSAMDDFHSVEKFRKAGANANIAKDTHVAQIIEELKNQYHMARTASSLVLSMESGMGLI